MKAELYSKISKYVLYAFAAIILVVFALFFFAGEPLVLEQTSEAGEVTELPYPQFMEPSLYLCYAMCLIALLLVLVFESVALVKGLMDSPQGLVKKVVRIVIAVVAIIALYFVSPTKLDFVLYLQYALFGIAALCMLGSFAISKMRS
ncbi:MAG: hypothetical protein IKY19_02625 [Bacteroidaceae bacterium]|nr:hypothetical protein [Bacteroidaceae bacterium]